MIKVITSTLGWFLFIFIALDLTGFCMWTLSGQTPVDDWYIGTATAHALQAVGWVNK